MRNPFALLGLKRDADEAAIKRAYAQRLRQNRPDEDPAAFQALNEAYRRCLEIVAQRGDWEDQEAAYDAGVASTEAMTWDSASSAADDGAGDATPAPDPFAGPTMSSSPQDEVVPQFVRLGLDADGFIEELIARMRSDSPRELEAWLLNLEPLYSLELKLVLRAAVTQALAQVEPPPRAANVRATISFFGLNSVSQRDAWLHAQAAYALQRAQGAENYETELARSAGPGGNWTDRLLVKELEGPTRWLRRCFIALTPGLSDRVVGWWMILRELDADRADTDLDSASIAFWQRATDRNRLNWRRLLIGMARAALYYLFVVGAGSLILRDTDFLDSAVRNSALVAIAWLAWIASSTAAQRLCWLIERHSRLDGPLTLVLPTLIAAFATLGVQPLVSVTLSVAALIGWASARGRDTLMEFVLAGLMCSIIVLGTVEADQSPPLALAVGAAVPIVSDFLCALVRREPLRYVRRTSAWLWPLFGIALIAMFLRFVLD